MLAVQYLEYTPDLVTIPGAEARAYLRMAFDCLPISHVILGWSLPDRLTETCAAETARAGAELYLWYPLLTGSSTLDPRPEWHTIGPGGERVPGFQDLPEFTFLCPNRPAVSEAVFEHFRRAIRRGLYQGVFLDRIRYPSPITAPDRFLACFCPDCRRVAATEGFDLSAAQRVVQGLLAAPERLRAAVQVLLDPSTQVESGDDLATLRRFLDFRARSVTRFVQMAAEAARGEGLAVGLDCFSPALSYMVGQNLAALNSHCDWIKIMTYGHTLAPAGLPYELLGLARWLMRSGLADEREALNLLGSWGHLPLPTDIVGLAARGLSAEALAMETRRARAAGVTTLLAGIELVDLEGVTWLESAQIAADLRAFREAAPDGLVLSWDLRRIASERLEIVRDHWCSPAAG